MKLSREESLFLATCAELQNRLRNGTAYDLLLSSGLIRKLVLDGSSSLYVTANRRLRIQFEFPHHESPVAANRTGNVFRGFANVQRRGSIDRFLSCECIYLEGRTYTVHEVIDAAAHKHGGVHLSPKLTDKEKLLVDWRFEDRGIRLMDGGPENPMLILVYQIGVALLDTFAPLIEALRPSEPKSGWRRLLSKILVSLRREV